MENNFWGDYHTHTKYSHGKGTVLQNAMYAKEIGLKEIAITDHGFSHIAFGLRDKKMKSLIADVKQATLQTGVNVMLGIESNLTSLKGTIDVKREYGFDIVLCYFHKAIYAKNFDDFFKFWLPNISISMFKANCGKKQLIRNTDAIVKAVENCNIDIVTHPNYDMQIDCKEFALACANAGTFIEISGKKRSFDTKQFEDMISTGAKFIMNSDAHSPQRVGNFDLCYDLLKEAGVGVEIAENYGKKPQFASQRRIATKTE